MYTQDKISKIIEWLFYIILCCISLIFMSNVLQNYSDQKTSFTVFDKPRTKLPILTFCFVGFSNEYELLLKEYAYGLDFVIHYNFEFPTCYLKREQWRESDR